MPSKKLFSGTEPLQLAIKETLTQSRTRTLQLFEGISEETFRLQANPDFSPVGGIWDILALRKDCGF